MSHHRVIVSGDVFEVHQSLIDVTSLRRPDTNWCYVDVQGHEHRWYVKGQLASEYDPAAKYETPTLRWRRTGWGYDEDGERYPIGHFECRQCRAPVDPAHTTDLVRRHIAGPVDYRINDESVEKAEFDRRFALARDARPVRRWPRARV